MSHDQVTSLLATGLEVAALHVTPIGHRSTVGSALSRATALHGWYMKSLIYVFSCLFICSKRCDDSEHILHVRVWPASTGTVVCWRSVIERRARDESLLLRLTSQARFRSGEEVGGQRAAVDLPTKSQLS